MFFWPRNTPGMVSTSKSVIDSRCLVAKLRTLACTVAMSSITWAGRVATISSISAWLSRNDSGLQLSNFSEYSRTAASPLARMSAMTSRTTATTWSWLAIVVSVAAACFR